MSTELELETFAGKSIQAYKEQAQKAGLVLRAPSDNTDSGDFPEKIYSTLRRFRRNMAITKDHKKVVEVMARQLVTLRDEKGGRPTKKEFLTYTGYYTGTTFNGEEHHADFQIGKYDRPKIVHNSNVKYSPKTGEPLGNEKALSGSETVYTIEVPKTKEARKKLIDSIIGDNFAENIHYYYMSNSPDEPLPRRDNSFNYLDFISYSIEELRDMSFKGGGAKSPGIWRDKDGKLRDRNGNLTQ